MKLRAKFVLIFLSVSVIPIALVIGMSIWAVHSGKTDTLVGTLLSVGFILTILVIFFALQFGKYIAEPIITIAKTATRLSQGDLSQRVAFQSSDEIGELALRFNEMASQIEHIDTVKSDFINLASHHLRTPQTIIKASVEELLSRLQTGLTPEQVRYLEFIRKGSEEMHDVAETLLTVSKVQLGNAQPHIEPVNLNALLQEVVDQFKNDAQVQGIKLEVNAPSNITVPADQQLLRVALRCIVRNAVFFTGHGSVRITASLVEQNVQIQVTDTGVGIPAEDLPAIFTKFFQAKNGKQLYPTGKGLGLYLARICVETLGGKVSVLSELGKGSAFTLTLPIA